MTSSSDMIVTTLLSSIQASEQGTAPYTHWLLNDVLPADIAENVVDLPFPAPDLSGVSGKRELHNATRTYFDTETQARFPAVDAFAKAFQDRRTTDAIAAKFGTALAGSYLRIEYAQDVDGFWLEPHTDLGVKVFTMLLYLSTNPQHSDLGTDIFDANKAPVGRSPFLPNGAMVFVPSDITYHGFEARPIDGVRKSIIINFVTDDWRAREQLAFPKSPIA